MRQVEKKPCSVCGESGDGAHFGAEACRACAAFFRRSVAMQKTYTCRAYGKCEIQSPVRCMCRACRFDKCIKVGMKKTAVQRHRDMLGRRFGEGTSGEILKSEDDCSSRSESRNDEEGMPILRKIKETYAQMDSARKVVHNRDGENVFSLKTRSPRAVDYKEASDINTKEIKLGIDFLQSAFPEFRDLPTEQKKVLYKHFFLAFMLLETGYFCSINDRTDIIVLPSGDYIDCNRPETFYYDASNEQNMTTEDAVRLFAPSFKIYRRNILDPMRKQRVKDFEFFALTAFVLWDHGLDGESRETEKMAMEMRDRITRELIYYYSQVQKDPDYVIRLTNMLVLLPSLQRAVRRFQEDVEISNVFNIYAVDNNFYEIINGKI